MKKKKLKQYLDKEWRKAHKSLKRYTAGGDPETLHHFRVQVKKLRAFAELAQASETNGNIKKYLKPLKKIFREAGDIRDARLHIVLGEEQGALEGFLKQQKQQMKRKAKRFRTQGRVYLKRTVKSRKKTKQHVRDMPAKDIRTFYNEQLHWVDDHLSKGSALLHPCRKRIKTLMYNYKFAHKARTQHINRDYLKILAQAIGDWHDNHLAAKLFPELEKKEQSLQASVRELSKDFYRKATA